MQDELAREVDYSKLKLLDYVGVRIPSGPPVRMMLFEGNYLVTEEEGTVEEMIKRRLKPRKVAEVQYEKIYKEYRSQRLLERQGASSKTPAPEPEPPNEDASVYTSPAEKTGIKPKFKPGPVGEDGTYAVQKPDKPSAMARQNLTEDEDKSVGDVVDANRIVAPSKPLARRSIPTIAADELRGELPGTQTAPKPASPKTSGPKKPATPPGASARHAPEAVRKPAEAPERGTPAPEKKEHVPAVKPKFAPAPPDAAVGHVPTAAPSKEPVQRMGSKVIGTDFPDMEPAKPPKPAAPRDTSAVQQPPVRKQPAGKEEPAPTPAKTKPGNSSGTAKAASAKAQNKARNSSEMLYDEPTIVSPSTRKNGRDRSFTVVTSIVSVAIVALLAVATLLLLYTSGIIGKVNQYDVVVLTGNVSAGETITEKHIGNVVLSKDEYDALTSGTFEVESGGEAIKEIPVPYERRVEVIGLIANEDYAAGSIVTNRMVADQRTITNKYYTMAGENGKQQLEVTIDSSTGMATITVYAIAPNESGDPVAILIDEATLTEDEFIALLKGDTEVLLNQLVPSNAQVTAQGAENVSAPPGADEDESTAQ